MLARDPAAIEAVYGIRGVIGYAVTNVTYSTNYDGGLTNVTAATNILNSLANALKTGVSLFSKGGALLLNLPSSERKRLSAAADGAGHSLVLARPSYGEGSVAAWSASDVVGGSPGREDTFTEDPMRSLVINELLANPAPGRTDFVELFNRSAQALDLSGLVISEDGSTNGFRIPSGRTIVPFGFQAFYRDALGFGLKASGQSVFLVNSNGTRILDAVRFDAQPEDISWGRYPDGDEEFHAMTVLTPSARNSGIVRHDVGLNEIMYNPISGSSADEFVELYNKGTNAIDLSQWRISGGIGFIFPTNIIIPPHGYFVVAHDVRSLVSNHFPDLNCTSLSQAS